MESGGQEGGGSNPNPQTLIRNPKPTAHQGNPRNHVKEGLDPNLPTQVSISGLIMKPIFVDVGEKRNAQESFSPTRPLIKQRKKQPSSKSRSSKGDNPFAKEAPTRPYFTFGDHSEGFGGSPAPAENRGVILAIRASQGLKKLRGGGGFEDGGLEVCVVEKEGEENPKSPEGGALKRSEVPPAPAAIPATAPADGASRSHKESKGSRRSSVGGGDLRAKGVVVVDKPRPKAVVRQLGSPVKKTPASGARKVAASVQHGATLGKGATRTGTREAGDAVLGEADATLDALEDGQTVQDTRGPVLDVMGTRPPTAPDAALGAPDAGTGADPAGRPMENQNPTQTRNLTRTKISDPTQTLDPTRNLAQAHQLPRAHAHAQAPFPAPSPLSDPVQAPFAGTAPHQAQNQPNSQRAASSTCNEDQNSGLPPKTGPKSFASFFRDNRTTSNGMKMKCLSEPCVDDFDSAIIDPCDLVPFVETWGFCLIGCFTGVFPGRAALDVIVRSWGVRCKLIPHGKGWTIFKFLSAADRDLVFQGGPYMQYGKTLMLKLVEPGTVFTDDLFMKVPTWCRLPGVPLSIWGESGLSKLASKVGFPHCTDQITKERTKLSYARILIEVDVSKKPRLQFGVRMPVGMGDYVQRVEYESYPMYCCDCKRFGHNWFDCPQKVEERQGNFREARPTKPTSQKEPQAPKPSGFSVHATPYVSHAMPSVPHAMPSVSHTMPSVTRAMPSVTPTPPLMTPSVPFVSAAMSHMPAKPVSSKSAKSVATLSGAHGRPLFVANSFGVLSGPGETSAAGEGPPLTPSFEAAPFVTNPLFEATSKGGSSVFDNAMQVVDDALSDDEILDMETLVAGTEVPAEGGDPQPGEGVWQEVGPRKRTSKKFKKRQDRRGGAPSSSVPI